MRRPALYSSASHPRKNAESRDAPDAPNASPDTHSTPQPSAPPPAASPFTAPPSPRLQQHLSARPWVLIWTVISLMGLLLALSLTLAGRPAAPPVTQQDINAAVLTTLKTRALPSPAAKAYQIIAASVVSVVGLQKTPPGKDGAERSVRSIGTGVVIVDKGTILTSLHVVRDAQTIQVTFANGLTSAATLTGMQPENDLAVLQAQKIPSDLRAATLHSAPSPAPGDLVMAVGFPVRHWPVGLGRGDLRAGAHVSDARRPARHPPPDPVRRCRQPRQLGRPAGHHAGRGDRYRHRHLQPQPPEQLCRHRICRAD